MGLISKQYDDFVWELKYRPDTLDKVILPDRIFKHMESVKLAGKVPNMLFTGGPGTGKTTTALVLAEDMDLSAMYLNMSLETSIEAIRNRLTAFASTVSLDGRQKVFIGDEFDRISPQAMDSLKGVIEKLSSNCKFIFTSNHKGKIIEPIVSRLQEVDFVFSKDETGQMKKKMWKTACMICQKEEVEFEKKAIAEVVKQLFPDMRKILNHMQMLSLRGPINVDAVQNQQATDVESYFKMLRDGDWTGVRQYIVDLPIAFGDFYSIIYNNVERYIHAGDVSSSIIMVAKYQKDSVYVTDKQIPLAALSIEMMNLNFKKDF